MTKEVTLDAVNLKNFGLPSVEPHIPAETYHTRLALLRERAAQKGYTHIVVYADREHAANLAFLTGYDPRFEEALLVVTVEGEDIKLLVGNEGLGYTGISPIKEDLDVILYQSFSLLGQARDASRSLKDILRDAGLSEGATIGVVGWKYYDDREFSNPDTVLEIPSLIADTLRELAGTHERVQNAGALFMNPRDGLRSTNDVHQLARFEFAACYTSQAVRSVLFGLQDGLTEFEAVELMKLNGLPLSCHLMLSSGERAFMGLASPTNKTIQRGDAFTTAYGVWGALNCRAGFVVESAEELPEDIQDYVKKLVKPYFQAIAAWYEAVGIGVQGGELYKIVHDILDDPFFGVGLNPGHLIHLDEWVHSPIYEGSDIPLQSGMAIQVDVIPATHTPYFTTNIEDGIALADETLRDEFQQQYPQAWKRITERRTFMQEGLGITLKPEVLPFSNIPAYLPPYLLSPYNVMCIKSS